MTGETPLRWIHFRAGPEGAGVYVHIADLLKVADEYGVPFALDELCDLLDEYSTTEPPVAKS